MTSHTVAHGDTLWTIAKAAYGKGHMWQKIYDANKAAIGADPDELKVGEVLTIPA